MRLNKFIAQNSVLSRRSADEAIIQNRVLVNGKLPTIGQQVDSEDKIELDNKTISNNETNKITIMLNKPTGYVCSRDGQGSKSVYELLPENYQTLQSIGRLDKDSSGLLLFTNDGELNNLLSHPSNKKFKKYIIETDRTISSQDINSIINNGVAIGDKRLSTFGIKQVAINQYEVTLEEGRNRQIRRTLKALGYNIKTLERTAFGEYLLKDLKIGQIKVI